MLREQSHLIVQTHKFLDILLTVMAFIFAYFIKKDFLPESFRGLTTAPNYYIVLLLVIIIWYLTLRIFNSYAPYRKQSLAQILWKTFKAVIAGIVLINFMMYVLKIYDVSRIMMGIFFISNIILLGLSKVAIYKCLTHFREKGFNFRNILIIGGKERAKDVINSIGDRLGAGYKVLGCLGLHTAEIGKSVKNGIKYIGTVDQLKSILLGQVVDEIIFAMPLNLIKGIEKYMAIAEELGVPVRIIPDWQLHKLMYKPGNARLQIEDFLGFPTMFLTTTPSEDGELILKNALDYLCATILFVIFLPIFLVIAVAIKLSSIGPILFAQERCGLNGRKFMAYKFRTMKIDSEETRKALEELNEVDGPVFKMEKDPRIVPYIGTFLRKTGLDELPQLINVIKGEMSLVGPRPPIPSEVEKYDFWQRRRLSMKPGITCLWQCTPKRNDICFKDWMNLDLKYIDNWSLKLDFKILFRTALVVFTGQGR
jgi:exopolysaccharide biosynthesis polyprenyl glycosylphosphotransferase